MNRKELIQELYRRTRSTRTTQAELDTILTSFCDIVLETVQDGDKLFLRNFGSFEAPLIKGWETQSNLKEMKGKKVQIPDRRRMVFTPSQRVKEDLIIKH